MGDFPGHLFDFASARAFDQLFVSITLREFAFSLVSIFVPLYLLNLGFSLNWVLGFYLIQYIMCGAMFFLTINAVQHSGARYMMLTSLPVTIAYLLLLNSLWADKYALLLLAVLGGVFVAMFWAGCHADFARYTSKKKRGSQIGALRSSLIISGMLGPLLGGGIVWLAGFNALFILTIVLLVISMVPLYLVKDHKERLNFNVEDIFKKDFQTGGWLFLSEGVTGMAELIMWPVFLLTFLANYMLIGLLSTGMKVLSAISAFLIGKFSDEKRNKKWFGLGSVPYAASFILRPLSMGTITLAFSSAIGGIAYALVNIPLQKFFYDTTNKNNALGFILFRELCLSVGRVGFLGVLIILPFGFKEKILAGFLIGCAASFGFLKLSKT